MKNFSHGRLEFFPMILANNLYSHLGIRLYHSLPGVSASTPMCSDLRPYLIFLSLFSISELKSINIPIFPISTGCENNGPSNHHFRKITVLLILVQNAFVQKCSKDDVLNWISTFQSMQLVLSRNQRGVCFKLASVSWPYCRCLSHPLVDSVKSSSNYGTISRVTLSKKMQQEQHEPNDPLGRRIFRQYLQLKTIRIGWINNRFRRPCFAISIWM